MSDYCVCQDCGCKHLVWEKSCPYCRRIAELEAENKVLLSSDRVKELEQRLEIDPRHNTDGIEARDETIKGLEAELAKLRKALERIANRQGYWTPDVAVAKAALEWDDE